MVYGSPRAGLKQGFELTARCAIVVPRFSTVSRCVTVKAVFQAGNSAFLLHFVELPTRILTRMNAGVLPVFVTKCVAVRGCFPVALPHFFKLFISKRIRVPSSAWDSLILCC
jgi:hypothetical protein